MKQKKVRWISYQKVQVRALCSWTRPYDNALLNNELLGIRKPNVLTPFKTDNFNMCNPDGSPRDLSRHVDEDVPGPSGIRQPHPQCSRALFFFASRSTDYEKIGAARSLNYGSLYSAVARAVPASQALAFLLLPPGIKIFSLDYSP